MRRLQLYIAFSILLSLSSCKEQFKLSDPILDNITLKVKADDRFVDQDMLFYVESKQPTKIPITLLLENGLMSKSIKTTTNTKVNIASKYFEQAGLYTLSVFQKTNLLDTKNFFLQAKELVDPIEVYAGPNTIVVGAKEESMLVSIPCDSLDNPISNKSDIDYQSTGAQNFINSKPINHLLSIMAFSSTQKAGDLLIGVSKNDLSSREQKIGQTPDWGMNFSLTTLAHHPYADNRQYTQISTTTIKDQFANLIPDGTLINFDVFEKDKLVAAYKAISIDGKAKAYIKNPATPTQLEIVAHINNRVSSNRLLLNYKQLLSNIEYHYSHFNKLLKIGPLNSVLGPKIPDGTLIELIVGEERYRTESYDGYGSFSFVTLDLREPSDAKVEVAGMQKIVELNK